MTSRNSSEGSTTKEGMGPLVESAKKEVSKLKQLLNEEFECIKTDQLDRLKALHESKNEILASISLTKDDFEATGIEGGNELISAWSSIIDEINKYHTPRVLLVICGCILYYLNFSSRELKFNWFPLHSSFFLRGEDEAIW